MVNLFYESSTRTLSSFDLAAKLFEEIALAEEFPAFLTLRAYEHI